MTRPYTTPKDCGGYPDTRECLRCKHRWHAPTSGETCPWCSCTERLKGVLKTHGAGHCLEDLQPLKFEGSLLRQCLKELARRGEATNYGKYWWLKVREPKRGVPKPAPLPPSHPIQTALNRVGIQATEQGGAVKRTPRRKP